MLIMQAIVETLFDTVYLFSVITIGILMIRKSKGNRQFTMFGIMAVLLGSGDAFSIFKMYKSMTQSWYRKAVEEGSFHGMIFILLFQ